MINWKITPKDKDTFLAYECHTEELVYQIIDFENEVQIGVKARHCGGNPCWQHVGTVKSLEKAKIIIEWLVE